MESSKVVTFCLGSEEYAVPIVQVVSIERMQPPMPLPKVPPHVRGVLNIRDQVLPIADLRTYLLEKEAEDTDQTRIIIIDLEGRSMGLVVDEARDVLDIDLEHAQPVDLKGVASECMLGIARQGERLVILLNLSRLLDELDPAGVLAEIQEAVDEDQAFLEEDQEIDQQEEKTEQASAKPE